ncbi:MAG TPA: hypothetical protein VN861_03315 [Candidatus Acidoferrales bacterium]|nr:hypothetical protein [Candidatus Acidoferrales bacterium]
MSTSPATPDYSPTSKTPYRAPETPPLPEIAAPPAHADMQQPAAPSMVGGKTKGIAVIATLADSILRGAVRGRDYANQVKAQKQQRMAQGLNYNYQTARNNYLGMLKSGADPNSKQVQEAKNAADAAWEIQQQFYQNMFGQDQGKKGKSKKSSSNSSSQSGSDPQSQQPNPMAMWASGDPVQRLQAAMIIRQKAGPDYQGEAAQYTSPQYRRQIELMRGEQRVEGDIQQKRIDLHDLQGMDPAKLTPDQESKLERLRTDPELFPQMAKGDKKISQYVGQDGKEHLIWQKPDGETYESLGTGDVRKPVSETKPIRAWSKDTHGKPFSVEVDPKTNQIIPGTENHDLVPPSDTKQIFDTVRTGEFSWKDEQGQLHRTQTSTTTEHVPRGTAGGAAHAAPSGSGSASGGGGIPPSTPGDRIIGSTGPTGQTKSRADAADSVMKLLPQVRDLIKDPQVREQLGALPGRWSEVEAKLGTLDPKTRELLGALKSVYSLAGAMHGWRSVKVADEFEKAYGGLHTDPDSLLAGMDAMEKTAKAVYETGYKHPDKSAGGGDGKSNAPLPSELKNKLDTDFGPAK